MKNAIGDSTEEALTEIRKTLFLGGYRVWKKRKLLVKEFWTGRAPDEWKKQEVKTQDKKKKKRYNPSHCTNPFHYLKKHSDFSKQRETRCPCSITLRAVQSSGRPEISEVF